MKFTMGNLQNKDQLGCATVHSTIMIRSSYSESESRKRHKRALSTVLRDALLSRVLEVRGQ